MKTIHMTEQQQRTHYRDIRARLLNPPTKPKPRVIYRDNIIPITQWVPAWKKSELRFDQHVIDLRFRSAEKMIREYGKKVGIRYAEIVGKSRCQQVVRARQLLMWEIRKAFPHYSLPQIGRLFGGRDHTTVLHALRAVDARKAAEHDFLWLGS